MIRYLETFSAHRVLLLAPLVLALAASVGFVVLQPRSYEASARLLVYGTSLDAAPPGSPYSALTPAEQQEAVLKELLTSRSFSTDVGQRGPLASYFSSAPSGGGLAARVSRILERLGLSAPANTTSQHINDLVYDELNKSVRITAAPPQIVGITYQSPSAEVAAGTLQAVIDEFSDETLRTRRAQSQAVITFFEQQLAEQQKAIAVADVAVAQYLATHPAQRAATAVPDATLTAARHTDDVARERYTTLQLELDQAKLDQSAQDSAGTAGFRVIDPPAVPTRPVSLVATALRALLAGLAAGLLISGAALLTLTAADRSLRRPDDVKTALGLRLVGTVPRLR